jgi:hypothetical protein
LHFIISEQAGPLKCATVQTVDPGLRREDGNQQKFAPDRSFVIPAKAGIH